MRGLLLSFLFVAACSSDTTKSYPTYQACFDDVIKQGKTNIESIVQCCLEETVSGMEGPVCGADEPECINYLTLNIKQTDAEITIKQQACAAYVVEKAMQ